MDEKKSLDATYFDDVYRRAADPWNFQTSEYESGKYAETLKSLPKNHYENAWEIGCSIGVLTEKLAARCAKLLAIDVADAALAQAAERCRHLPHVTVKKMRFPDDLPGGKFDLILISEVAYYLSPSDWMAAQWKIVERLTENGSVVLVHWTPEVHDYPQTGDAVHASFINNTAGVLRRAVEKRTEKYRLDAFEKIV